MFCVRQCLLLFSQHNPGVDTPYFACGTRQQKEKEKEENIYNL
jgi:hypothetical protein